MFSTGKFKFQQEHTLEKRKSEAERIRRKYPDRIPVIVEKIAKSKVADIDKKKYLVPSDLTIGQFMYVIRKRIQLKSQESIYVMLEDNSIPPTAQLMSQTYKEHKNEDGFLYISYMGENTFGNFI